jgi:hypothetical protein
LLALVLQGVCLTVCIIIADDELPEWEYGNWAGVDSAWKQGKKQNPEKYLTQSVAHPLC